MKKKEEISEHKSNVRLKNKGSTALCDHAIDVNIADYNSKYSLLLMHSKVSQFYSSQLKKNSMALLKRWLKWHL